MAWTLSYKKQRNGWGNSIIRFARRKRLKKQKYNLTATAKRMRESAGPLRDRKVPKYVEGTTRAVFPNRLILNHIRISYAHFYAQEIQLSLTASILRKTDDPEAAGAEAGIGSGNSGRPWPAG